MKMIFPKELAKRIPSSRLSSAVFMIYGVNSFFTLMKALKVMVIAVPRLIMLRIKSPMKISRERTKIIASKAMVSVNTNMMTVIVVRDF
jgi:hypothetical protein